MNFDQGFELPYMAQDQRIADEYLASDVLAWYTAVPESPVIPAEYFMEQLSQMNDETVYLYINWAKGMEDSFPFKFLTLLEKENRNDHNN